MIRSPGRLVRHVKRLPLCALIALTISTTAVFAQTAQNTTSVFQYDANGNLTKRTDPNAQATTLIYDPLNRLTQQVQPAPAIGIPTPTLGMSYDGRDQLSSVTDPRSLVTRYTNDGLGNQTTLTSPDTGTTSRTYDLAGNLTSSTDARGKKTTYTYDALNRVTSITYATGVATTFEYDGGTTGAPNAKGHLTKVITRATDNQIVWRWDATDPFGLAQPNENPAALGTFIYNPRFPGQLYDRETNLNYNYFRDYDPQQGRYVESDLIGLDGGVNTYAYAEGNPLSKVDPTGQAAVGTQIGGYLGGMIAAGLGLELGPLDIAFTMAGRAMGSAVGSKIEDVCTPSKPCPPCKTVGGKIVSVGTVGYRPLDFLPDNVVQHGVGGSHHNIFVAKQNPNNCQCFWAKQKYVLKPDQLPSGAVPIEEFVN